MNNRGVILLVDDEPSVRRLMERVLVRAGYTVMAAGGGHEATAIAAECDQIDLLITDFAMPVMNGLEVAKLIRDKRKSLEVLYMSGYNAETISEGCLFRPDFHFLEKPFTPSQIVAKVGQLIAPHAEAMSA